MSASKTIHEYIREHQEQLAKNPDCGVTHYNLGVAYLSLRKWKEAEEEFFAAIEASSSLAEAYVQLGGIRMYQNDLEGCLYFNQKAVEIRPKFPVPHGNIGFVHMQRGDAEKAVESLRQAVSLDPKFIQAHTTLASAYYQLGKYDECIDHCWRALKVGPAFAPAYNNLALAYYEKGDFHKAIENLDKAKEFGFEVSSEFEALLAPHR